MRRFPWWAALIPLLAVPGSAWLGCAFFSVCQPGRVLVYQWPAWFACYLPYWVMLFFFHRQFLPDAAMERPGEGHPRVAAGLRVVNASHAGTALRFAATVAVVLYWKDEEYYKPIYIFLLHMGCFFLFQLACMLGIKK